MKVFLIRHATRNFTMGDVPLNDEGLEQAHDLVKQPSLLNVQTILSSPKKRALMTMEPLGQKLNLEPQVLEELDQMRRGEGETDFKDRVSRFIDKISAGDWAAPVIVCTHSDWLGMAAQTIPTDMTDLKYHMFQCAEFMEFDIVDGLWMEK